MRHLVREAGLQDEVTIDSAGTGAWHLGEAPDARATAAARLRGIALGGAARRLTAADFERFDLLLVADHENLRDARALAPDDDARAKVRLLREFDPAAPEGAEVPDPFYGAEDGFEEVLDVVEAACRGLLDHVRAGA
jgi:protein-tyrosine phosphatase